MALLLFTVVIVVVVDVTVAVAVAVTSAALFSGIYTPIKPAAIPGHPLQQKLIIFAITL